MWGRLPQWPRLLEPLLINAEQPSRAAQQCQQSSQAEEARDSVRLQSASASPTPPHEFRVIHMLGAAHYWASMAEEREAHLQQLATRLPFVREACGRQSSAPLARLLEDCGRAARAESWWRAYFERLSNKLHSMSAPLPLPAKHAATLPEPVTYGAARQLQLDCAADDEEVTREVVAILNCLDAQARIPPCLSSKEFGLW